MSKVEAGPYIDIYTVDQNVLRARRAKDMSIVDIIQYILNPQDGYEVELVHVEDLFGKDQLIFKDKIVRIEFGRVHVPYFESK